MEAVFAISVLVVIFLLISLAVTVSAYFSAQRESIERCSKILRGKKDD